jgi:hypothetical protein
MKHLWIALPLLLACGSKGADLTVVVAGVTMADLEPIRADLGRLKGVSEVRAGQLKEGQATFTLRYAGKGSELAADLARLGSGLKNVKGFDDAAIQISWDGKAAPVAPPPAPAAAVVPKAPPLPNEEKKPAPAPDEKKEVKVEIQKDPLAYKVHQLPAGTIATFNDWKIKIIPSDGNWAMMETFPDGKEDVYQLIVAAGTPEAQVQANLFEDGPKLLRQMLPQLRATGEAKSCTFGGDEARLQEYTLSYQGRDYTGQHLLIKKKDVAVSLLAFGTAEGMKEYGRALGITAQSITIKESPPDPALVGTWALEKYYSSGTGTSSQFSHSSSRSVTLYPNGTFTESSFSSSNLNNTTGTTSAYLEGGDRGKVIKRGTTLTFHYDNGKVWNAEYKLDGGQALVLNGNYYLKQ